MCFNLVTKIYINENVNHENFINEVNVQDENENELLFSCIRL